MLSLLGNRIRSYLTWRQIILFNRCKELMHSYTGNIIEKDISFEMTIHQMAFDEYTTNTLCMLWQIARMQVPCRLLKYKKYSCPLSSRYSWDSSNLQVGYHSSNVFEQSSSSNREMSFDGSSFGRICPWPILLNQASVSSGTSGAKNSSIFWIRQCRWNQICLC